MAELTTTEAAVLALVAIQGEGSRYDLMKKVSRAIGYVWAPAKTQLYTVLPRLADAGLVSSRSTRVGARPEKQLYRLTKEGRGALDDWLASEPGSVDDFYLRLFVGGLAPRDVLDRHLEWFRTRTAEQLAQYREIEPTNSRRGHDAYHYYLLRLGIERAENLLRWADWVADDLRSEGTR
jgi:DNA-binding PadR family transcriptional regulator